MSEELERSRKDEGIKLAEFEIRRIGDLIGTIGFGVLIALSGVPCIILNLSDPVIVILSLIPILFGLGWIYSTWRKWRNWRIFHPFELKVSPAQIKFGDEVEVGCRFTPTTNLEIEEINLSLRVTRITREHVRTSATSRAMRVPRPVLLNEDSVRVAKNIRVSKGEEFSISEVFEPDSDYPPSMTADEYEIIVWEGHVSLQVKGLKTMEAEVSLEVQASDFARASNST